MVDMEKQTTEDYIKEIRKMISTLDKMKGHYDVPYAQSPEKYWVNSQAVRIRKDLVDFQTRLKKLSK